MRILITGAAGFIGTNLTQVLTRENLVLLSRSNSTEHNEFYQLELTPHSDLKGVLVNVDVVIHLAARVHVFTTENKRHDTEKYLVSNLGVTKNLAEQAAAAGVSRFIFLSTIKVHGEESFGKGLDQASETLPHCAYGQSKLMSELALKEICKVSAMEYVIIRPPMVYGDIVKGNMTRLIKMILLGIPMPLSNVNNRRSFISVRNLCDFIRVCITSENANNQTFTIADQETISTTSLVKKIAQISTVTPKMFYINQTFLLILLRVIGKSGLFTRLYADLEVDSSHAVRTLGWKQPYAQDDELDILVNDVIASKNLKR